MSPPAVVARIALPPVLVTEAAVIVIEPLPAVEVKIPAAVPKTAPALLSIMIAPVAPASLSCINAVTARRRGCDIGGGDADTARPGCGIKGVDAGAEYTASHDGATACVDSDTRVAAIGARKYPDDCCRRCW